MVYQNSYTTVRACAASVTGSRLTNLASCVAWLVCFGGRGWRGGGEGAWGVIMGGEAGTRVLTKRLRDKDRVSIRLAIQLSRSFSVALRPLRLYRLLRTNNLVWRLWCWVHLAMASWLTLSAGKRGWGGKGKGVGVGGRGSIPQGLARKETDRRQTWTQ